MMLVQSFSDVALLTFPLVAVVAIVVAQAPCYVTAECYLMAL